MRGVIESYDTDADLGVIRANDGKRYGFSRAVIHNVESIQPHIPVIFVCEGDQVTEAVPQPSITGEDFGSAEYDEIDEVSGPGVFGYFTKVLSKYFDFRGRAQRAELWSFWLVAYGILIVLLLAAAALKLDFQIVAMIYLTFFAVFLIPGLAVAWRRFHDVGLGGAGILPFGIPVFGWLGVLVVFLLPSQRNTNRFGPHPRARPRAPIADVFS